MEFECFIGWRRRCRCRWYRRGTTASRRRRRHHPGRWLQLLGGRHVDHKHLLDAVTTISSFWLLAIQIEWVALARHGADRLLPLLLGLRRIRLLLHAVAAGAFCFAGRGIVGTSIGTGRFESERGKVHHRCLLFVRTHAKSGSVDVRRRSCQKILDGGEEAPVVLSKTQKREHKMCSSRDNMSTRGYGAPGNVAV